MSMAGCYHGFSSRERRAISRLVSEESDYDLLIWTGEKRVELQKFMVRDYFGEIDKDGNLCGYGILKNPKKRLVEWEGTFLDNK